MRYAATVYSKVLAEFLIFRVDIEGKLKNCDKTAARSDQQASPNTGSRWTASG